MSIHDPAELLTASQAAARAGISLPYLHKLRAADRFPEPISLGRLRTDGRPTSVAWPASVIDEWRKTRGSSAVKDSGEDATLGLFADLPETGNYIAGPHFVRVADALVFARNLNARIAVRAPRCFQTWLPSRGTERDTRILQTLQRQCPGISFEVVVCDGAHLR